MFGLDTLNYWRGFFSKYSLGPTKTFKQSPVELAAAQVRFIYALPVVLVYFLGLTVYTGHPFPVIGNSFLVYALLGGISQLTNAASKGSGR